MTLSRSSEFALFTAIAKAFGMTLTEEDASGAHGPLRKDQRPTGRDHVGWTPFRGDDRDPGGAGVREIRRLEDSLKGTSHSIRVITIILSRFSRYAHPLPASVHRKSDSNAPQQRLDVAGCASIRLTGMLVGKTHRVPASASNRSDRNSLSGPFAGARGFGRASRGRRDMHRRLAFPAPAWAACVRRVAMLHCVPLLFGSSKQL